MACTGEPDDPDDPVVKPRYSYVIHYVDADTGEKLHPNKTATSVSDGTERDIDSPEIKGYTLVNSNDRVVHVKIEGANFEYTVKYKKSETFDAVIEYQDSKTGETLNDPWTSNDLPNGHKENVTSPEIENCKIVKTGDDVVEVEIKDQDFHYVVKYECTVPDVPENPKTGDALIFIVWAVGAAALGYSIYYFNKYYKKNSI